MKRNELSPLNWLPAGMAAAVCLTVLPATAQDAAPEGGKPAAQAGASASQLLQPAAEPQEDIVLVTVDGVEIKRSDVDRRMLAQYAQQLSQMPPDMQPTFRQRAWDQIVEDLVNRALLGNASKDEKYAASPEEINSRLEELKASLPEGASFDEALSRMDLNEAMLREEIAMEMGISRLMEEKLSGVADPADDVLKKFYDENGPAFQRPESVSASHILISTQGMQDGPAKEEKKQEAEELLKTLTGEEPADFAELAAQHSDCPSRAQGGNLGTFGRGEMVPAFDEAAFSREVGKIGPIVETEFGYHIIRVDGHQQAGTVPFEEAKPLIAQHLKQQDEQKVIQGYLSELREGADIVRLGDEEEKPEAPKAVN